jgi:transposase-like protein
MTQDDVLFGYRLQLFDLAARTTVTYACRTFGVHRSTYYAWRRQVDREGLEMLRPRERRRPVMPNQLARVVEERIARPRSVTGLTMASRDNRTTATTTTPSRTPAATQPPGRCWRTAKSISTSAVNTTTNREIVAAEGFRSACSCEICMVLTTGVWPSQRLPLGTVKGPRTPRSAA